MKQSQEQRLSQWFTRLYIYMKQSQEQRLSQWFTRLFIYDTILGTLILRTLIVIVVYQAIYIYETILGALIVIVVYQAIYIYEAILGTLMVFYNDFCLSESNINNDVFYQRMITWQYFPQKLHISTYMIIMWRYIMFVEFFVFVVQAKHMIIRGVNCEQFLTDHSMGDVGSTLQFYALFIAPVSIRPVV